MKFENTEVFNMSSAIRGMRNALESWNKSDSKQSKTDEGEKFVLGENDKKLAQALIKAGSSHRKFMRQIFVTTDITAPLYWWKEFDTYKVGTTGNSTSTMHKLSSTPITKDCFQRDAIDKNVRLIEVFDNYVNDLETTRKEYIKTSDKNTWRALIQMLPESWMQTRTITFTYENGYVIDKERNNHKLIEWQWFRDVLSELPYASVTINCK